MNFVRTAVDQWWSDVTLDDGMPIGFVPYLNPGDEQDRHLGPGRWWRHLYVEAEQGGRHYKRECSLVRAAINPDTEARAFRALEVKVLADAVADYWKVGPGSQPLTLPLRPAT